MAAMQGVLMALDISVKARINNIEVRTHCQPTVDLLTSWQQNHWTTTSSETFDMSELRSLMSSIEIAQLAGLAKKLTISWKFIEHWKQYYGNDMAFKLATQAAQRSGRGTPRGLKNKRQREIKSALKGLQ